MKCWVCGVRDAVKWGMYCTRCRKFIDVPRESKARAGALKRAYDAKNDCFRCGYSNVVLEERETKSPWYVTFDHRRPGVKGDLVVTCALVNSMKTDMDADEFLSNGRGGTTG